jgi:hypothetical protein
MKEKDITEILENNMDNVFACTRVWSAWSYNTMSQDDFLPFKEDEDFINDFKNFLEDKDKITIDELVGFFEQF